MRQAAPAAAPASLKKNCRSRTAIPLCRQKNTKHMEKTGPCRCRFSGAASWLHTHWQYGTPFLAVYTTFFLLLFVYPQDTPLFWVWICLPVYFVHQCEEYLWPGGFMEALSRNFAGAPGYDPAVPLLSPREAYWINAGIIWVLFPASAVAAMFISPAWGLWVPCFTVLNGISHIVAGIKDRRYNPGLGASLLLNIPAGTAAILVLAGAGVAGAGAWAASLLVAAGFMAAIAIYAVCRSRRPARR